MWDNPKEGELDPAIDDRKRCKKNSIVLSCIVKKSGCDRSNEDGTVHSDRSRKGPAPL